MYRGPLLFWGLVVAMFSAATVFGLGAEGRRRQVLSPESTLETGALVRLVRVADGDTVLVQTTHDNTVTVRLLGIKSLPSVPDKDAASQFGKAATNELHRVLADRPIRVMLSDPPKDRHGRYLAELFVDDQEVGLSLVRQGFVLVYSAYPFAAMPMFLREQELARSERRGLWAVADVAQRADRMIQQWNREEH